MCFFEILIVLVFLRVYSGWFGKIYIDVYSCLEGKEDFVCFNLVRIELVFDYLLEVFCFLENF